MSVLVCENISFTKKKQEIIKTFDYNFLENKIYGIIGRKQSGKTSLLNLISGHLKTSSGHIYLDGKPLYNNATISDRLCFVANYQQFPGHFSVFHICKLMSNFYPKWDNSYAFDLLEHFKISPNNKFSQLKNNEKSLFLGIIGLASRANITILDDPVKDADAKDRYDFFNFLYTHFEIYPRTFIIATNFIDEIDFAIDTVLFVDNGKLIDVYDTQEIKENFVYLSGKSEVLKSLISGIKIIGVEERGNELTVCIRQRLTKDDVRKYKKYLIKMSEVPIQKVFIHLINLRERKGITS